MKTLFAIAAVVFLWCGSCAPVFAYGTGTLADRYPQSVEAEMFSSLAQKEVEQLLTDAKETRRHTVELVKGPKLMRAPAGNITYQVEVPTGLHYSSMTPVYVGVLVDDVLYRKAICYFRVHVYENVLVASRNLFPDRELGASDIRQEEREVTSVTAKYLTVPADAQGKVLNRLVREGTMLTKNMLRNPVVIEAGASIYITTNINGILVKTEGVALQRGRAEEMIRVRNASSSKVLRARVLDASTVEVVQ